MFTKLYCLLNEETSDSTTTEPTAGLTAEEIAEVVRVKLEREDGKISNIEKKVCRPSVK